MSDGLARGCSGAGMPEACHSQQGCANTGSLVHDYKGTAKELEGRAISIREAEKRN